jgi:hypothetical protein
MATGVLATRSVNTSQKWARKFLTLIVLDSVLVVGVRCYLDAVSSKILTVFKDWHYIEVN